MPHRETRQVWLLLKNGVPSHTSWGHCKTVEDAAEMFPDNPDRWDTAACMRGLDPADGWDATPTVWRRPPSFLYGGAARGLVLNPPRLDGRDLVIGGCRVSLDSPGRAKTTKAWERDADGKWVHGSKPDSTREPERPDLVVENEDAMLATAEELGTDVDFVEKGTGQRWRAAANPGAERRSGEVLVHRGANGKRATRRVATP